MVDQDTRQKLRLRACASARKRFWSMHNRDEYTCPVCGIDAKDRHFEVHHRDGDWLNNHAYNLVGLCYNCHWRVHRLENIHDRLSEWKSSLSELQGAEI